jgi:hypothetical protein
MHSFYRCFSLFSVTRNMIVKTEQVKKKIGWFWLMVQSTFDDSHLVMAFLWAESQSGTDHPMLIDKEPVGDIDKLCFMAYHAWDNPLIN